MDGLFRDVVDAMPVATALLDEAGLVLAANKAFADVLHLRPERVVGEPFLAWLSRSVEREGFGRAFRSLRDREAGAGFALDLGVAPELGPRIECVVRSTKLADGHVVLTCLPNHRGALAPEAELGLAITRSLDALDQGVLLVDDEGEVVHANPAAIAWLGKGIVGRSVLELVEASAVPLLVRALAVARAGSWQGEVMLRRQDGEPLPVEISLAAGNGPAVMLLRDLRERRRREFEARLMAQVDHCLVASDDPERGVMSACAALAAAVRADRSVVLARTSSGWQRWTLSGDAPQRAVALMGEAEPPADWATRRDGELVDLTDPVVQRCFGRLDAVQPGTRREEKNFSACRLVLRAPSGVVGYLLLAQQGEAAWDPRDRALMGTVAAQLALGLASGLLHLETRELAAFQAMVLDQSSVLIGSVDEHGRVVTWNRAAEALLGVEAERATGQRLGLEVGVAVEPDVWREFWAALVHEGAVAREITLLGASGDERPLHLEGRLLREGEAMRGAVFVGLDLRTRRALETQILRSQKLAAVGLLAAGIAHEINNPLSGVVGYSKLLLERELPPQVRQRVEKIAESGERCRKIVEGVLLFSRQRDGGVRRKVDLRALMDRVIAIGEYQWRMHNVRILRERDEAVFVLADAEKLEQVALNLLSNAVDAMPRGGSVRIAVHATEAGQACLRVADEGHGIPAEIQARIFDPFFSTKEIGKGTGLGLAISYGIVQDHGGDIVVESHPGQGACFCVTLPAVQPPGSNEAGEQPSGRGPG